MKRILELVRRIFRPRGKLGGPRGAPHPGPPDETTPPRT